MRPSQTPPKHRSLVKRQSLQLSKSPFCIVCALMKTTKCLFPRNRHRASSSEQYLPKFISRSHRMRTKTRAYRLSTPLNRAAKTFCTRCRICASQNFSTIIPSWRKQKGSWITPTSAICRRNRKSGIPKQPAAIPSPAPTSAAPSARSTWQRKRVKALAAPMLPAQRQKRPSSEPAILRKRRYPPSSARSLTC